MQKQKKKKKRSNTKEVDHGKTVGAPAGGLMDSLTIREATNYIERATDAEMKKVTGISYRITKAINSIDIAIIRVSNTTMNSKDKKKSNDGGEQLVRSHS